jgi:hypothetical protein
LAATAARAPHQSAPMTLDAKLKRTRL